MSNADDEGEPQNPCDESFTNGFLVDSAYVQDVLEALQQLDARPGTPVAGKHGLVQIPVGSEPSDGKLSTALYEHLLRTSPAALDHYGRNRHCAIGALVASIDPPKIWPGPQLIAQSVDTTDPKIWPHPLGAEGGHTIRPWATPSTPTRPSDDAGLGVVVGMLDTTISSHEYLDGGFLAEPDSMGTVPSGEPLTSASGHATFVAGLILQQAPAATVHVKRVLNDEGVCESIDLHDAILELAEHPIDILNLSLGCTTADDQPPFAVRRALRKFRAARPNAIVVAAAGNHPTGHPFWPAALDGVQAVTCARRSADGSWDVAAGYPREPWVDIAAPGLGLLSTFLTGRYPSRDGGPKQNFPGWAVGSGTSFACAIVAGHLARNWVAGGEPASLLAIARDAGVPITRSNDLPVLGIDHLLT
jgi:subtilisin family serine protease